MHTVWKVVAPGLVYASVVGLTACATSADLESLRAEVATANATAVRAEAEASRTRRELATLKEAPKPPATFSEPSAPPAAASPRPGGYKWGQLPR